MSALKAFLTRTDNKHRAMHQEKVVKEAKDVMNKARVSKRVTFTSSLTNTSFPRTNLIPRRPSSPAMKQQQRKAIEDQKKDACYICHEKGHLSSACSKRRPPYRVNEIESQNKEGFVESESE